LDCNFSFRNTSGIDTGETADAGSAWFGRAERLKAMLQRSCMEINFNWVVPVLRIFDIDRLMSFIRGF